MQRRTRVILIILGSILILGVIGILFVANAQAKYDQKHANDLNAVCERIQSVVDSDPNYARITMSIQIHSVPPPRWLTTWRRAVRCLPSFLRLESLGFTKPEMVIVLHGFEDGPDPGLLIDKCRPDPNSRNQRVTVEWEY